MVSLSTTEAEYVAAAEGAKGLIWLKQLFKDLKCQCIGQTSLQIDIQGAIKLIKNPELHKRTKHIDIRYHSGMAQISIEYIRSKDQCADFLTKSLPAPLFSNLTSRVGMLQ